MVLRIHLPDKFQQLMIFLCELRFEFISCSASIVTHWGIALSSFTVVFPFSKFRTQSKLCKHATDLFRAGIGMALFQTTLGKCFNGIVQFVNHDRFSPGWHTPNDLNLNFFSVWSCVARERFHKLPHYPLRPILQSLGQMRRLNTLAPSQIRNRPRQLQNAMIGSCR